MYSRALSTSIWKIWMATILFRQTKTNKIWRMRTNTMANRKYWPHLPGQFLTINVHVAECPRMWILLTHPQSHFSNSPWCPRSYLLHLPLRPDHHLLQLLSTLSSRIPFSPWRPHSNRGQIASWRLHCFPEHPRQLPVLARHWLHSHQTGMWSLPILLSYSIF